MATLACRQAKDSQAKPLSRLLDVRWMQTAELEGFQRTRRFMLVHPWVPSGGLRLSQRMLGNFPMRQTRRCRCPGGPATEVVLLGERQRGRGRPTNRPRGLDKPVDALLEARGFVKVDYLLGVSPRLGGTAVTKQKLGAGPTVQQVAGTGEGPTLKCENPVSYTQAPKVRLADTGHC